MRHLVVAQEWMHDFVRTRVEIAKEQADRGDWVSYLAVVIFIAAITTAVFGLGLDTTISNGIKNAVTSVTDNAAKK
jgi:undecaprenyl pyrophosphate phosphatase UppP